MASAQLLPCGVGSLGWSVRRSICASSLIHVRVCQFILSHTRNIFPPRYLRIALDVLAGVTRSLRLSGLPL